MIRIYPLIALSVICVIALLSEVFPKENIERLVLIKALPVEGSSRNQPSGMTIHDEKLFAVSDQEDGAIYRVELKEDRAVLKPHLKFDLKLSAAVTRYDFEGITCDKKGNFYLLSETACRILQVSEGGSRISWLSPSLLSFGKKYGFFRTRGAYLEGIALIDEHVFILSVERQPRALFKVALNTDSPEISVVNHSVTELELPKGRDLSFTGLFWEPPHLYAIQRSAQAIVKLSYRKQLWEEEEVWSYEHIENNSNHHYSDMRFGRAEGLCMDSERIYLILDNNGDSRVVDREDRRPLLFIMQRP